MKKILFSIIFLLAITNAAMKAQEIISPSKFLGYELGTQFTPHHKIVDYFSYISTYSKNVLIEKYGTTNENRPLFVSYISSEANLKNLEQIKADNLTRTGIKKGTTTTNIAIVWLSYNVHGNEASSTEAALLTIYNLVTEHTNWLKNTVVIIDPCLNPDGRDRYVNWYSQVKGNPYNSNPESLEHFEPWPSGRPNHYLFDLNRDWAWATQVETQQRLKIYNKWMPHIHVDFHEQGYNNPYYFAPAAEPYHELITNWQRTFQVTIGKNHAKYFDKNGWRYFTKEAFDLLYPSYGDSYPMFMGAIGMTYEQAGHGKAGLGILTENNTILTLKDRIEHHTTTGLSTIEIASLHANNLISEFEKYFDNSNLKTKSFILKGDITKIEKLKELLNFHEIEYFMANESTVKAYHYNTKSTNSIKTSTNDLVISTSQPKGKMVSILFEPETKISDSLTYDITAWSLPYAYGLEAYATTSPFKTNLNAVNNKTNQIQDLNFTDDAYAYIYTWNNVADAAFLGALLQKNVTVRFATNDFTINNTQYKKGSLLIIKSENLHINNLEKLLQQLTANSAKSVHTVTSGYVSLGADFGSSTYQLIKPKNVALLASDTNSPYSFGEVWHFFETQLKYPITLLNTTTFNKINPNKYDVLILPEGYVAQNKEFDKLLEFIKNGGTLIAIGNALQNFSDKKDFSLKMKKDTLNTHEKLQPNLTPFNQQERNYLSKLITGSIFKSTIDTTHPLAFGYTNFYYSLKLNEASYTLLNTGFNVAYFPENSKNIAGFAGVDALKNVSNSLLFGVEYQGNGKIIYMVDNPLFRSFWEEGKLFFANAIFFN